jgi:hypothetical protein
VLFPGFAYGLTRNVSFGGGISTIPGLGFDEQVYYANLQTAFKVSEKFSFSLGGLYLAAPAWDDDLGSAAVAYGLTTLGRPDRSLTLGFAVASVRDQEPIFDRRGYYVGDSTFWRHEPIAMVGGSARVARKLFLVSENWLFLDKPMSEQAFGLALRFFSGRISVDAGFVFVPEVLEEGLPLPWLSFSYHFGPSRSKSAASGPGIEGGFDVARRSVR